MGHQLARPALAAALIVALSACGGGDGEPPSVLDNALEQVEASRSSLGDDEATPSGSGSDVSVDAPAELPPPDPSLYEGANRVVNLWVGIDDATQPVDVWGRRTFTTGPILLAEGIGFGEATDYFSAPAGYSLVVVGAGAGPDGAELAGLVNATAGEQITTIFTNEDEVGTATAPNLWEAHPDGSFGAPEPPRPGQGLVYLVAPNTSAFADSLTASVGSRAFYVGDGTGECYHQRVEDDGFAPNVLGGTNDVRLDLAAGPATVTLHPWSSPDTCAQPASFEFTVDVPLGGTVMVIVYTPDGSTLDTLALPVD